MPITGKKVAIGLTEATPTALTVAKLKQQLTNIGLTCEQSHESLLQGYIDDVKSKIPNPTDGMQAWSILQPSDSPAPVADEAADVPMYESAIGLKQSSLGSWTPEPTALGYAPYLEYIQYSTHFDWLMQNRSGFTGTKNAPPPSSGSNMTLTAIKTQFEDVGTDASSVLVKGLDQTAIESALSNAIAPVKEPDAKNYAPGPQSRVFFLVENYDPNQDSADGIGVLNVTWNLTISDYLQKKGPVPEKHDYTLTVTARAVVYGSIAAMMADYQAAHSHFSKSNEEFGTIPSKPTAVKIFAQRPPANIDSFNQGLPVLASGSKAQVLVLYSPDLQNIGSVDNTASDVASTYSKAVMRGFTFSTTQTLSITASFEVSVDIIKAGISIGLSFSFTEQWSKQETETMSFAVPGKSKAFLYQGTLLATVLTFDGETGQYSYQEQGRVLSPVLVTSDIPIAGSATIPPAEVAA